ncbi:High cysteine membrane protein Group 1 [Giardia duodenalis]|uniref:High cysteine membrane protein Group 1 n=1 Tax=Giardia intestinalis (strain ATCC 50803 / WB clone C6) TaxID=184922 RepID=A0A644F782_GIAIC|nr:High cysteine membrane protein Group 1 [Giardia intestinalis]KAE8304458.1 High cysteine membrane protein Group 1 [Giardia intestinalis]
MSVLFLFGLAVIGLAAQPGDGSTPYKNDYYVACTGYKPNCVQDKCVRFGRGVTLCTECTSGKVPINGGCVGKDDADSSIDIAICAQEDGGNGGQRCTSCTGGKGSRSDDPNAETTYFLFYGGCYSKDEWPGSHICKTVSSGMCSVCETDYENVFTNSDTNAEEKCILCGDTVGFNGKVGMDGCSTCVSLSEDPAPNNAASTASIQCTSCSADDKAPINGQCTDVGSNECKNGYCTHCAVGYVYHKGGCYNKESGGNNICAEENQINIAGYSACKQCANTSEAPHNGNCGPTTARGSCNKDVSSGKCTACNKNFPGLTIFLYEGGCYSTRDPLGSSICVEAFNGRCTTCNEAQGYYKKDPGCSSCDASISNCAMCVPGSDASSTPICIGCKDSKYAAVGGASCVDSCPADNPGSCDENGICRCSCGSGTYLDTGTSRCEPCDPACADCTGSGPDRCISCASGKYIKYNDLGTTECVDSAGCGEGYYGDDTNYACTPCGIEGCQTCTFSNSRVMCTKCSQGFVSVDSSSCVSQCNGPNQQPDGSGRCVCAEGFEPSSDGACIARNTCPSDATGCSSCSASGECLSCADSNHNVQPSKRSCASGCPSGSESVGSLCICMEGYILQDDTCVSQTRKASSSSTTITVAVVVSLLIIAAVALACWLVLRRRRGSKPISKKRAAAENVELMGTVDEF